MKASEILLGAAELLEQKFDWCRNYYALDADGEEVQPLNDAVVQLCAVGAMQRAAGTNLCTPLHDAGCFNYMLRVVGGYFSVSGWNDEVAKDRAEVIATLKQAAAYAEKQGE